MMRLKLEIDFEEFDISESGYVFVMCPFLWPGWDDECFLSLPVMYIFHWPIATVCSGKFCYSFMRHFMLEPSL